MRGTDGEEGKVLNRDVNVMDGHVSSFGSF